MFEGLFNPPARASAVMQGHPRSAPERVPDTVLYGHVSAERRAVVDVWRLPEWAVRAAHVVVVPA